jgi:hypothetical protein
MKLFPAQTVALVKNSQTSQSSVERNIQARAIARVTSPLSFRTTTASKFRPSTSILEPKAVGWQRIGRAWRYNVFESVLFLHGKDAGEMVELELGPSFIYLLRSDGENADPLLNVVRDWWRDPLRKNFKTKESLHAVDDSSSKEVKFYSIHS